MISGTTIGAVMGYGMGIYLVFNGITFDKRFLLKLPAPEFGPGPQAQVHPGPQPAKIVKKP